jgi:probable rRNA maturation factor
VIDEGGAWPELDRLREAVAKAAAAVASELGVRDREACLALSCDEQIARLNGAFRGKPEPTNVLSFPARSTGPKAGSEARFLGDVVLAAETVSREAAALGLPLTHHLQHLIVHGLLHLLGYDHETEQQAQAMEALEARILASLGIADPYGPAREPPASSRHKREYAKS